VSAEPDVRARRDDGRVRRTMRALTFHGPEDVRLEEVPQPEPGAGDVLVQIEAALTDSTDAKAYRRGHPVLLGPPPTPFCHEFAGVDVATGRRVVAPNSAPCGACSTCARGEETLCKNLLPLLNGAYAEYIVVPERIAAKSLLPVPAGVPAEIAAMVEPLACCLHGVDRAEIEAGQTVAVVGTGPIGLMLCAAARDAGARVVAVGGRDWRQELAREFGAEPGPGDGADVVIEAAGTADAWRAAVGLVRPGGTVVFFGGLPRDTEVSFDAYRLHYEELTLRGAFHHTPRTVRAALAFLASGAYPWARLLTHRVGLEGVVPLLSDPPPDLLKAVVIP
jgi:L-iditol 2-dehydrogenase